MYGEGKIKHQEGRKENTKGKTHPSLSEKVEKVVSPHCRGFTVLCKQVLKNPHLANTARELQAR